MLVLGAAPAYAQTTPTTLGHIYSRLEAFREMVWETYTQGGAYPERFFMPISFRLQKSDFCLTRANILCRGVEPTPPGKAPRIIPNVNRARAKLRQCEHHLAVVLAKLCSRDARRIIPPDVAAALASETGGIASDLKAARESLTCPRDPAVGRTD